MTIYLEQDCLFRILFEITLFQLGGKIKLVIKGTDHWEEFSFQPYRYTNKVFYFLEECFFMKKKKKSNTPRHKRLNRVSRLHAAKHWIPKYKGNNIVKGYSIHFGVDKLCAVNELTLIGVKVEEGYIKQLKAAMLHRQKSAEKKNKEKEDKMLLEKYLDDEFNYYTCEYLGLDLDSEVEVDFLDDEIPF